MTNDKSPKCNFDNWIAGYYNEDTMVGRYLKTLKQSYEQFGGAAQAKMTRAPNSNPAPFKLPFQPRAWQEEVAAGEGRQGCEAVNGVCEPAPDGDEQQCDNRQHVKGAWAWAKLSMTVTVKPLVGTKYVEYPTPAKRLSLESQKKSLKLHQIAANHLRPTQWLQTVRRQLRAISCEVVTILGNNCNRCTTDFVFLPRDAATYPVLPQTPFSTLSPSPFHSFYNLQDPKLNLRANQNVAAKFYLQNISPMSFQDWM